MRKRYHAAKLVVVDEARTALLEHRLNRLVPGDPEVDLRPGRDRADTHVGEADVTEHQNHYTVGLRASF